MRCHICNHILESYEIVMDRNGRWSSCNECRMAASEAVFDEGTVIDEESENELPEIP